jgi:hypothetical protein
MARTVFAGPGRPCGTFFVASRRPAVHETCHGDGPVSQFDLGHNSNNRDIPLWARA